MMNGFTIDRRRFLRGAGGAALIAGVPLAGACSENGDDASDRRSTTAGGGGTHASGAAPTPSESGHQTTSGFEMPAHVSYPGVETDMPATKDGSLAGYASYPKPPVDAIASTPGSGQTVTAFLGATTAVPPPMDKNAYWQHLNKVLGATMDITVIPRGNYAQKLATTLASGDLPDLLSMPPTNRPDLPAMLAAEFADLTEFLSGDAVKTYPMLANLPSQTWRSVVFDNAIRAVPTMNSPVSNYLIAREDIAAAKGLDPHVSSADEFLKLCVGLTDAGKNQYAAAQPANFASGFAAEMFGAPNRWRVDDGAFVNAWATPEFKDALGFVATMWKRGVFHPDSFTSTGSVRQWFGTGTTSLFIQGGIGYGSFLTTYGPDNSDFALAFIPAPKADGGGAAQKYLGSGVYRMTAIPQKASKDKIAGLLAILNYLAAPFGTAEYLDTYYGAEETDWTWKTFGDVQAPDYTPRGTSERIQVQYLAGPPFVLFNPGYVNTTRAAYAFMKEAAATGLPLPTVGLHSNTDDTKGASIAKPLGDLISDIIQGRKSVSDWDGAVATWRKAGGDTIAAEYAAALAVQAS